MQDETINIVFALLLFFGLMSVLKGRGMGRRQRDLQRTIDHLQSVQATTQAALPGASKEQVARLEERIRVLERIVTDRGSTLAAEIEALRDSRFSDAREMERNDP